MLLGTWQYDAFTARRDAQDKKLHINFNGAFRGGWRAGASVLVESFGFDSALYADYEIELPRSGGGADTVPFTGTRRLPNLDWVVSFGTPDFEQFSRSAFLVWGRDENFFEWASADILYATLTGDWRPTDQLRGDVLFSYEPTPGTVFFAGYGSTMREPDALRFSRRARDTDAFFVKMSYLYRL